MSTQEILNLLLLLSPIILIQLGLAIYALVDLAKRENVRGSRLAWAAGLVLSALAVPSGLIVVGIYLVWGRHPEEEDGTAHDTG